MWATVLIAIAVIIGIWILVRIFRPERLAKKSKLKTCIVLGSGGHTTEALKIFNELNLKKFTPRCYILAETDKISEEKALEFESGSGSGRTDYEIYRIPRSREVRQNYLTSVFSTLKSIFFCIPLIFRLKPDFLLCNGPGTCIPIVGLMFLMKILGLKNCLIIFVESICRVETLSLSAKLLYYLRMVDGIIVQWPELVTLYPRCSYLGRLF